MEKLSDALYQLAKLAEDVSDARKWMKIALELLDLSEQTLDGAIRMYCRGKDKIFIDSLGQ